MKTAVFSTKPYDQKSFEETNTGSSSQHEFTYFEPMLNADTAPLAAGHEAVCVFVHDPLDRATLEILHKGGTRFVALRCAGFNNVDLDAAHELGISVARVPAYSPYAVAEHATGLILSLNRKLHHAYNRVREGNFALEGLLGFDLYGKTVGVIGLGRIGISFARIMNGFGCKVLAHDSFSSSEEFEKVSLERVLSESDIISLHCPLLPDTHYLINEKTVAQMKPGAMLINTSRGGLIDAAAMIEPLRSGQLGALGLDVYENEDGVFYDDRSGTVWGDDTLMLLMSFPNVLVTGHQAFFTREALGNIAQTTIENLTQWEETGTSVNSVSKK